MSDLFPNPRAPAGEPPAPPAGPPPPAGAPVSGSAPVLPTGQGAPAPEEPDTEVGGAGAARPSGGTPRLQQPARGRRPLQKPAAPAPGLTPEQRLLLLDAWRRSGLPAPLRPPHRL